MGKDDYSGADIAFINNTLHQLESKKGVNKIRQNKKKRKAVKKKRF